MLANRPIARLVVTVLTLAVPLAAVLAFLIVQPEMRSVTLAAYAVGFILFMLGTALMLTYLRKDRAAERR